MNRMASRWGLVGSGNRLSSSVNVLPPPPELVLFNPTDISGLAFWLDANDTNTVLTTDASGLFLKSWADKVKGVDVYYPVDLSNTPLTNTHFMNGLPVVYFPLNAALLNSDIALDFNARSVFVVCKPLAYDLSGGQAFVDVYHGNATADMQVGMSYNDLSGITIYQLCSNGVTCGLNFDISGSPLKTRMILAFLQSATDVSGNQVFYDTVEETPILDNTVASYNPTGQYMLSSTSKNQSIDIAEILIYDTVLKASDRIAILDYLADKWSAQGITPEGFPGVVALKYPAEEAKPPAPEALNTSIIYGAYIEGEYPNFYWCDDFGNVEIPYVLAAGYDGTTAYRDGTPITVTNVFYS